MATSYTWEDRGTGGSHASDKFVSVLTIPNGSGGTAIYAVRDEMSRAKIQDILDAISSGVVYIGKTNTALTDGASTATITLKEGGSYSKSVTLTSSDTGSLVTVDKTAYTPAAKQDAEFIWDGAQWIEFGSTGELGAFAYVDTGDVTVTDLVAATGHSATITTTSTNVTIDDSKKPGASLANTAVSGTVGTTLSGSAKYDKTTSISADAPSSGETKNYTPGGSVNITAASGTTGAIVTSVSATDATATNLTGSGTSVVPSYSFTVGANDETLTITPATAITATTTNDFTPVTNVATSLSTSTGDPSFVGTDVLIKPVYTETTAASTLALASGDVSGSVTSGTVTIDNATAGWIKYDKADSSATVSVVTQSKTFSVAPHTGT